MPAMRDPGRVAMLTAVGQTFLVTSIEKHCQVVEPLRTVLAQVPLDGEEKPSPYLAPDVLPAVTIASPQSVGALRKNRGLGIFVCSLIGGESKSRGSLVFRSGSDTHPSDV